MSENKNSKRKTTWKTFIEIARKREMSENKNSKRKTTWQIFIEIINKYNVGDIITRQELLLSSIRSTYTIDIYRMRLTTGGFLKPSEKLGEYILLRKIPSFLKTTHIDQICSDVRNESWKLWFFEFDDYLETFNVEGKKK